MLEVTKIIAQYATIGGLVLLTLFKFAKYAFGKWVDSSIALERQRDQQSHNERMAQINSQFAIMQRKEDVRFQSMHPERITSMIALYQSLLDVRDALQQFALSLLTHQGNFEEQDKKLKAYYARSRDVHREFESKRFYFSQSNIEFVNKVFSTMEEVQTELNNLVGYKPGNFPGNEYRELRQEHVNIFQRGHVRLSKEVHTALMELEEEIRTTLGVENLTSAGDKASSR
jgi:hypothetical protein